MMNANANDDVAFYTEDVCSLKDQEGHIGIIARTTADSDSHTPHPHMEYRNLACHKDISKAVFKKFKHDGIPPTGTVMVEWHTKPDPELIPTKYLVLVDRSLIVGDVVKKNAKDDMSGTVVQTKMKVVMYPVDLLKNGPLPPSDDEEAIWVSAADLQNEHFLTEGDLIVLNDWVGRIDKTHDIITVEFAKGRFATIEDNPSIHNLDAPDQERFSVGDTVSVSRRVRMDPVIGEPIRLPAKGHVINVETLSFTVQWMWKRGQSGDYNSHADAPPASLDTPTFGQQGGKLYDPSRCPTHLRGMEKPHVPFLVGDRVRFKDPVRAAEKYPKLASTFKPAVKVANSDLDLDVNTFSISLTCTQAKVLWQDQKVEETYATELVPDYNIDDESGVWPGEIVVTNEEIKVPREDWIFQPQRVGVVQTVSPVDRIASVKWFPNAMVRYNKVGLEQRLDELSLLPDSTLGLHISQDSEAPTEEVTLYDIRTIGALTRRRGDFVVLLSTKAASPGAPTIDWFGEVIELNLDGTLTVRLGAAKEAEDVRVSPENTRLVHSSDTPGGFDGDADYDSMDEESDSDDSLGFGWSGSDEDIDVPWTVDGKPVDEAEDEEWDTEDEDGDTNDGDIEMADAPDITMEGHAMDSFSTKEQDAAGPSPLRKEMGSPDDSGVGSTPAPQMPSLERVPEASIRTQNIDGAPPSFDILESEPPPNHPYLLPSPPPLNRSRLKRIQKEHSILLSSLPEGVFVRTWDSRLDLLRVLIVGPLETPYEFAPFLIDLRIPADYPQVPPEAFFHSWGTNGNGPVNPNLYENGKICLSLLGTWHAGEKGESWGAGKSTILQVLVSILGLVLVKEPYYNEAGFEARAGTEDARIPSQLYSEKTYFKSRGFLIHALSNEIDGFEDVVGWLYGRLNDSSLQLANKAIEAAKELITAGDAGVDVRAGLKKMSKGAIIMLKRKLEELEGVKERWYAAKGWKE